MKHIPTASDSPCLCIKFTQNDQVNQLIYGSGKEFYKMDLTYLQSGPVMDSSLRKSVQEEVGALTQQPIAVCVISSENREAILLCFEEYGLFLVHNLATNQWQLPFSSSKTSNSNLASSNHSTNYFKWPRGNMLTPLQIEFYSSYLYLFYNDCVIVYNVHFESDSLVVRKQGVSFVYKPR